MITRSAGRGYHEVRPLKATYHITDHADGSVFFELGNTKVLVTVSLVDSIPLFMRGKKSWWLSASYTMLPASTHVRTERESIKQQKRSIEISRLIGRCLRSVITLAHKESEKTVHVDCDVIQADGSTRTACISAAYAALVLAQQKWLERRLITQPILNHAFAGISLGVVNDAVLVDIDFSEDSRVCADYNFVMTSTGQIIELQGSSEKEPVSWNIVQTMYPLAHQAVQCITAFFDHELAMCVVLPHAMFPVQQPYQP